MIGDKYITVLELNTVSMRLRAAETRLNSYVHTVAEETRLYGGFVGDVFYKPEEVFNALRDIFTEIDKRSVTARRVYVIIPQSIVKCFVTETETELNGRAVVQADLDKLNSKCVCDDPSQAIVEYQPISYKTFANPVLYKPIGEVCDKLYATVNCATVNKSVKELFDNAAKRLGKKFVYVTENTAVLQKALEYDLSPDAPRIVTVMREESTTVGFCVGKATLKSKTIDWGGKHFVYALQEGLKIGEKRAETLVKKLNLNLDATDEQYVLFDGELNQYFVKDVNYFAVTFADFLAKEIKKAVDSFMLDYLPPMFFTGSEYCAIKGENNVIDEVSGLKSTIFDNSGEYIVDSVTERAAADGLIKKFWRK